METICLLKADGAHSYRQLGTALIHGWIGKSGNAVF
jgi:hypothetical protein